MFIVCSLLVVSCLLFLHVAAAALLQEALKNTLLVGLFTVAGSVAAHVAGAVAVAVEMLNAFVSIAVVVFGNGLF